MHRVHPRPFVRVSSVAAIVAALVFAAAPVRAGGGPTLYGVKLAPLQLVTVDPANGAVLTTIGAVTSPGGANGCQALAMDPTTGTMYCVFTTTGPPFRFGRINLSTAAITEIAVMSVWIREMTFDATGKLWAITGVNGPNPNSILSVNTATGAVTVENGTLPTINRNKIEYNPNTDTLYLLGDTAGAYTMYTFAPTDPTTFTPVPLTGDAPSATTQPPLVYDPYADVLIEVGTSGGSANWGTITLGGVMTDIGAPGVTYRGLAWDQASTAVPVELSAFGVE